MKIGKKLMVVRVVFLTVILGISSFSYWQLTSIKDDFDELQAVTLEDIYTSSDIKARIGVQGVHLRQYVLQKNDSSLQLLQDEQKAIESLLNDLKNSKSNKSDELIAELEKWRQAFNTTAARVIALADEGDQAKAVTVLGTEIRAANLILSDASTNILEHFKEQYAAISNEVDNKVISATTLYIIMFVLSLFVSIVVGIYLKKSVVKPLERVEAEMNKIAAGDLTGEEIHLSSKDEIGKLAESFNKLQASIKRLIFSTKENAEDFSTISVQLNSNVNAVLETSEEVAQNAESITGGTMQASQIASGTANAMEDTSNAIQNIAESTQAIFEKAQNASKIAKDGDKTIDSVQSQMKTIYNSTKLTSNLIETLSESSEEIRNITKVITDITDQTNLLALNAAIEAARAGEHGKGFTVVADEVRKLAEQSKASATSIEQLTATILNETKHVEQAVESSLSQVEQGVEKINDVSRSFNDITGAVDEIVQSVAEVSTVAEQISATTQEVTASVNDLSLNISNAATATEEITQQIEEQVASIDEVSVVAHSISDKAKDLNDLINTYKI